MSATTAVSQDLVRDCDQAMRSPDAQATQPAGDTATRSFRCASHHADTSRKHPHHVRLHVTVTVIGPLAAQRMVVVTTSAHG